MNGLAQQITLLLKVYDMKDEQTAAGNFALALRASYMQCFFLPSFSHSIRNIFSICYQVVSLHVVSASSKFFLITT